jgi:hypothetical protein
MLRFPELIAALFSVLTQEIWRGKRGEKGTFNGPFLYFYTNPNQMEAIVVAVFKNRDSTVYRIGAAIRADSKSTFWKQTFDKHEFADVRLVWFLFNILNGKTAIEMMKDAIERKNKGEKNFSARMYGSPVEEVD